MKHTLNLKTYQKYEKSSYGWVAQLECHPAHQKVVGSISNQSICLGCGLDLWPRCVWEATDRCFSLTSMFLFLSLSLSLSLINNKKYPQVRI